MESQTKWILRFKPGHSPQRYVFSDPDTRRVLEAPSSKALLLLVQSYRAQNNLEPLDFAGSTLEDYLCRLPENVRKCSSVKLDRSIGTIIKGGVTLLYKSIVRAFVDQNEADRRAQICVKCPHNIFPDKGPFMEWADMVAEQAVGRRRSKHHNQLGSCEICTCVLRSKVFFKGPFGSSAGELEKMKQVGCWIPVEESK